MCSFCVKLRPIFLSGFVKSGFNIFQICFNSGIVSSSVVDPNTLNLDPDPDPGFWTNLDPDPDPGLYNQF